MNRIAATILAAGAIAGGVILASLDWQGEPGHTYRADVITDCAQAKADDKTAAVRCEGGGVVTLLKWTGDLPAGYELVRKNEPPEEIAPEALPKPVPLALPQERIYGHVRYDVSERADGSAWRELAIKTCSNAAKTVCTEDGPHGCYPAARCQCWDGSRWLSAADGVAAGACVWAPPHEIAGRETARTRFLELRPEFVPKEVASP